MAKNVFVNYCFRFEAFTVNQNLGCRERHMLGMPIWYLYLPPIVRFLQARLLTKDYKTVHQVLH